MEIVYAVTETMRTTVFRDPMALGCSVPSAVRALLQGLSEGL